MRSIATSQHGVSPTDALDDLATAERPSQTTNRKNPSAVPAHALETDVPNALGGRRLHRVLCVAMSMLGQVVFCVDCDLARSVQVSAAAAQGDTLEAYPRRMAIKTDANRDALCAPCLDARLAQRRAEFVLHQGGATIHDLQPGPRSSPQPIDGVSNKWSSNRIIRKNGIIEATPTPATKRRVRGEFTGDAHRVGTRVTRVIDHKLEHRFLEVAVEIGFARARELLDMLKVTAFTTD